MSIHDNRSPEERERERREMESWPAEPSARERRRDSLAPAPMSGVGYFRQRAEQYVAELRETAATQCPGCPSAQCERALACRFHDAELDGQPMCKHITVWRQQRMEAERIEWRRKRLQGAGYTDERLIGAIAKAWSPPQPKSPDRDFLNMWRVVRDFEQNRDRLSLVLCGGTGVGKTVCGAWLVAGIDGAMVVRPDDIVPDDEWSRRYRMAMRAPFVLIEDAGLEPLTERRWHSQQLEAIISARHDAGLRTHINTNLPPETKMAPDSLEGRYGARVFSRLRDKSRGCVIHVCGKVDLRRAA